MALIVSPAEQALLTAVDTDLESAMANGVAEGVTTFLPPLPQYTTIPANLRATGRQGILSTFAALVTRLLDFSPDRENVTLVNGFNTWWNPDFNQVLQTSKTLGNEIVLSGLVYCPTISNNATVGYIDNVAHRPAKSIVTVAVLSNTPVAVYVMSSGEIFVAEACTDGQFLSFDNIRFRAA
jgi:hypothetical protein